MTKEIKIGNTKIGGGNPVAVQSMCNIPFSRFDELSAQVKNLIDAGCDIIRISVPDRESAEGFAKIRELYDIPLVADIHFNYSLALAAMDAGADKIRVNPGNMGSDGIKKVVKKANEKNIPIRVGVNGGSLEKSILEKYGAPTAEALAESAYKSVELLENEDFYNTVVSLKSSDVSLTVKAARVFRQLHPEYPMHIGVTEAGTLRTGLIKNSAGIGALLIDGIGETIRYSLAADPVEEVHAGISLLRALGIRKEGLEVISCPTCGRTTVNSVELANRLEKEFATMKEHLRIAVMGCVVNGIGEAGQSDFGVTGADGKYIMFRNIDGKTEIIKRDITEDRIFAEIKAYADRILEERKTR